MPSLLALDMSTHVGWSFWRSTDILEKCGTWHAPKSWGAGDYGRRFRAFHDWLCDQITELDPDVLAFESPLTRGMDNRPTTEDTMRLLIGLASVAELVAHLRDLRCYEVHGATVKVALAGTARIPSKDKGRIMVAAAHQRGFMVADSHQADSCGVALEVYGVLAG